MSEWGTSILDWASFSFVAIRTLIEIMNFFDEKKKKKTPEDQASPKNNVQQIKRKRRKAA